MLVRFTKTSASAREDEIACIRPTGLTTSAPLPRQGILPRLAFHFVVETTLGWHDAVFGRLAAGASFETLATALHTSRSDRRKNTQALQCLALIECLEAEQWGGACDPAEFAQRLLRACRRRAVPPPDITAEELERVRVALRNFGAAWRPLAAGGSLERTF